jgi:tetratricopeptide (TPR) repeat protein
MQDIKLMILGNELYERGKYSAAIKQYISAMEAGKPNSDAFYRLALAYEGNNQLSHALVAIQEAVKGIGVRPEAVKKYEDKLNELKGETEESTDLTLEDILVKPDDNNQIINGFDVERYEFVELDAEVVEITKRCSGIRSFFSLSEEMLNSGQIDLAVGVLKAGVNASASLGSKSRCLYMMALILVETERDVKEAKQYLDIALEIDPSDESSNALKKRVIARQWQG